MMTAVIPVCTAHQVGHWGRDVLFEGAIGMMCSSISTLTDVRAPLLLALALAFSM